jgi:hypothetical protein
MKPEDNPNPNSDLANAEISDQERDNALKNFMHPEDKPKIQQKSWIRTNLTRLLVVGGLIVICGVGAGIYEGTKPHIIPSTFDASAMKAKISPNDSVQMTFDEYTKATPPIWDGQNKTLTVPVPILFANNRNPTLGVEKVASSIDGLVNQIQMDDLEPGDVMFSPVDGTLMIQTVYEDNLTEFDLEYTDSQGETITITGYSSSLKPLISFADATP